MNKQPEKTAQTKRSMIDAFWRIAKNRGLANVTISEVTKKAGLNRGTFYVYFDDLEDLLCQAEEEIICDLRSQIRSVGGNMRNMDIRQLTELATETIGQYDDTLFLLLGKNGDPLFLDRIRNECSVMFATVLPQNADSPNREYIIAYITSAFTGLLQYWHENGKKIPLPELSGIAYNLLLNGIQRKKDAECP